MQLLANSTREATSAPYHVRMVTATHSIFIYNISKLKLGCSNLAEKQLFSLLKSLFQSQLYEEPIILVELPLF